jgi:hypothetical protein
MAIIPILSQLLFNNKIHQNWHYNVKERDQLGAGQTYTIYYFNNIPLFIGLFFCFRDRFNVPEQN